jgi:hypothetical protein
MNYVIAHVFVDEPSLMPVEIQVTIEDLLSCPVHYSSGVIPDSAARMDRAASDATRPGKVPQPSANRGPEGRYYAWRRCLADCRTCR